MNNFHNEYSVIVYSSLVSLQSYMTVMFFFWGTTKEKLWGTALVAFSVQLHEQEQNYQSFKKCQSYSIRFLNRTVCEIDITIHWQSSDHWNQWVELKNLIRLMHNESFRAGQWNESNDSLKDSTPKKGSLKIRHHYLITSWTSTRPGQFSGNHNIYFNLSVNKAIVWLGRRGT